VRVKSVVIEDLRKPPYRATVDFEKRYYGPDRSVHRVERYLANFVFVIQGNVPNALIPVNTVGLDDYLFPRRPGVSVKGCHGLLNALFITTIVTMALALAALQGVPISEPLSDVDRDSLTAWLCSFFAAGLFLNLFAAIYTVSRKLFLKIPVESWRTSSGSSARRRHSRRPFHLAQGVSNGPRP